MEDKPKKIFSFISLPVLLMVCLAIWFYVLKPDEYKLRVVYLDVGQGDSEFIKFPDGKNALIDGGPDKKVLEGLGRNMPFYKHKIDIIFLSHPHADHVSGLVYVLRRYKVGRVVLTKAVNDAPEYQEFLELVKDKNIPVTEGIRGTEFDFSQGNKIEVLYPGNVSGESNLNNTSEVLMLTTGKSHFLFMGDLEKDGTDKLMSLEPNLLSDVVKVPHHGSQNALSKELYSKIHPEYAVISAGKNNKYGHPSGEVVNFLESLGVQCFRTDQSGNVGFISGENSITLSAGDWSSFFHLDF